MRHRSQRYIRKLDASIDDLRKAKIAARHRRTKRAIQNLRHSLINIGKTFRSLMKLER